MTAREGDRMLQESCRLRHAGHLAMPEVGEAGQEKLRRARVLVVGAGGLGSPAAMYLAAAGVGTIGVVDHDRVELSNLQRQILHATADVGRPKVESASLTLQAVNPEVRVEAIPERVGAHNALDLVRSYDVVVDGLDNFPGRYLLNDACWLARRPLVEAAILRFRGMAMTIVPGEGPCYRCVFPEPPPEGAVPSCREAGVIGALAGVMGTIQAAEVLKLLVGVGVPLVGRLLTYDALEGSFQELCWGRQESCALCGKAPTVSELREYELRCGVGAPAASGGRPTGGW